MMIRQIRFLNVSHQDQCHVIFFLAYPEQQSAPIPLVAGQNYYFEGLLKENTWDNHLAIAWEYDGMALEVIPAYYSKMA